MNNKLLVSSCILFFFLISCSENSRKKAVYGLEKTTATIEDDSRHFYPILVGTKLYTNYKIYNSGKNSLMIAEVQSSCGCVVTKFSKTAILPGSYGIINVEYDSSKTIGYAQNYIDIYANLASKKTIVFDVNVVPNSDYTRDYEEIYATEEHSNIKEAVNGNSNQHGYYTDQSPILKN